MIQYSYDGRQRKSQVFKNSALLRSFVYLDQTRMLAEQNSSGGFRSVFVWGEKPNTPEYLIRGGQIYKLIVDPRGSVRLVVNAETGEVVSRMSYDEFGRRLSGERVGFQPFQFAGGRRDIGSGLLQFGARHYDPVVGRWISKDPIGFDGGDTNLYGYVLNDPVNFVDFDGKSPFLIIAPYLAFETGFFIGATINRIAFNVPYSQTYRDANPLLNFTESIVPT